MSITWTVLVPLFVQAPDPEDVKPGWLGFAVFLLLAAAVVVLAFSFVKQLRKARTHFDAADAEGGTAADAEDAAGRPRDDDER